MDFFRKWTDLVFQCMSSVCYQIRTDHDDLGPIVPERGLCQGDPISLYLFLLRAKGLSGLLKMSEQRGHIQGCRIKRGAPSVSHLFLLMIVIFTSRLVKGRLERLREFWMFMRGLPVNKLTFLSPLLLSTLIQQWSIDNLRVICLGLKSMMVTMCIWVCRLRSDKIKLIFLAISRKGSGRGLAVGINVIYLRQVWRS